jgi:membrane-associated phospholipid phosphatase
MKVVLVKQLVCGLLMSLFVSQTVYAGYDEDCTRKAKERVGDVVQVLIPAVALASTAFYEDVNQTHWAGTEQWVKAFLTMEILTEGLKVITHKQRPNGCSYKSFPSGHTAAAFMGSTFIYKRYGLRYAIPAYLGAVYVGYSRVQANKHYAEDVFCGAVIGMASSLIFTKPYKGICVTPMIQPRTVGISVSKDW